MYNYWKDLDIQMVCTPLAVWILRLRLLRLCRREGIHVSIFYSFNKVYKPVSVMTSVTFAPLRRWRPTPSDVDSKSFQYYVYDGVTGGGAGGARPGEGIGYMCVKKRGVSSRTKRGHHGAFHFAVLLSLSSRYYSSSVATRTASLGLVGLLLSILPL